MISFTIQNVDGSDPHTSIVLHVSHFKFTNVGVLKTFPTVEIISKSKQDQSKNIGESDIVECLLYRYIY